MSAVSNSTSSTITLVNPLERLVENYAATLTFLICVAFLYPRMHYAFDVTDAGHHLSNAQVAFRLGIDHVRNTLYHFLTHYLAGAYLALLESLGLGLWYARLGWLLLMAGSIALAVKTMQIMFKPHWLWLLAGLAAVLNRTAYSKVPDYEAIPAMMSAIFIFVLTKALSALTLRMQWIFGTLSGVILICVILSRLTAASLLLCLLFALVVGVFHPKSLVKVKSALIAFFGALLITAIIFVFIVHSHGLLEALLAVKPHTKGHSTSGIILKLISQLDQFLAAFAIISLLAATCMLFALRKPLPLALQYLIAIILMAAYTLYIKLGSVFLPYVLATVWAVSFIFASVFTYRRLFRTYFRSTAFVALFAVGCSLPFLLGLGTYGGFDKLANGAWFSVIFATALITTVLGYNKDNDHKPILLISTSVMLIFMSYKGYETFHRYNYGDFGTSDMLTVTFDYPRLRGIQTQPGRKESFEALLSIIEANSKPQDMLLAYNNIPMIYYASNRRPAFDIPWLVSRSEDRFKWITENLCASRDTTPVLIIRTKVETRSGTWGNNPAGPEIVEDAIQAKTRAEETDRSTQRCHPKMLWENNDFKVFQTSVFP
jgi:hypothetical protein